MSHVTEVKLKIRDIDDLKVAAEACGLEFRENQTTYAWWGTFVGDSNRYGAHDPKKFGKGSLHAIGIPGKPGKNGSAGPWEIGVVNASDGDGYSLLYDNFGGAGAALEARAGKDCQRLGQEYAAAVAMRRARATLARKGFTVTRENEGQRIRLRLRRR